MELSIVESLDERLERFGLIAGQGYLLPEHIGAFYATLRGLEQCSGAKVLEIGGAIPSLQELFTRQGADYHNIRLEPHDEIEDRPDLIEVGNYMDIDSSRSFDLIISYGVFEEAAIDRQLLIGEGFCDGMHSNKERLGKLVDLTLDGGFVAIGAGISNRCLFTEAEMRSSGLEVVGRAAPFYRIRYPQSKNPYAIMDISELYLLRKPSKKE